MHGTVNVKLQSAVFTLQKSSKYFGIGISTEKSEKMAFLG
jgi:hypothetical protein